LVGAPIRGGAPPQRLTMGAVQENQTTSTFDAPAISYQLQQGFWGGAQAGEKQMGGVKRLAVTGPAGCDLHDPPGADPLIKDVLRGRFGAQRQLLQRQGADRQARAVRSRLQQDQGPIQMVRHSGLNPGEPPATLCAVTLGQSMNGRSHERRSSRDEGCCPGSSVQIKVLPSDDHNW
jgi:hypothetical protein